MVSGGGWWYFTLPSCIAPGDYLMRAELIGKLLPNSRSLIGHTDTNSPPLRLQRRRRAVLHVLRKHPRYWQRIHRALWRCQPSRSLLLRRPVSLPFSSPLSPVPLMPCCPSDSKHRFRVWPRPSADSTQWNYYQHLRRVWQPRQ